MPLEQIFASPGFKSRSVDVAGLPHDSLARIAEMSRALRQRAMADEGSLAEHTKFRDEAAALLARYVVSLEDEEALAREVLNAAATRTRDDLCARFSEGLQQQHGELERLHRDRALDERRRKKMRALEAELHREAFRSFWATRRQQQQQQRQGETGSPSPPRSHTNAVNATTALLRHAYQFSAPPFATDPEELWRRGVTVPPDLQRAVRVKARQGAAEELTLPAYHDFAMRLRQKYERHVEEQRQQALLAEAHRQRSDATAEVEAEARGPASALPRCSTTRAAAASPYSPFGHFAERFPFAHPPQFPHPS